MIEKTIADVKDNETQLLRKLANDFPDRDVEEIYDEYVAEWKRLPSIITTMYAAKHTGTAIFCEHYQYKSELVYTRLLMAWSGKLGVPGQMRFRFYD